MNQLQERLERIRPTLAIANAPADRMARFYPGAIIRVEEANSLHCLEQDLGIDGCVAGWVSEDE